MDILRFIKAYCDRSEESDLHGRNLVHYGSIYNRFGMFGGDAFDVWRDIPDGFAENKDWSDGYYRVVWINKSALTIITYCEGDISINTYYDREQFEIGMKKINEYYVSMAS